MVSSPWTNNLSLKFHCNPSITDPVDKLTKESSMNTQSPCKGHDNDDEDEDGVLRTMSLVQNKNQRWKGRREI